MNYQVSEETGKIYQENTEGLPCCLELTPFGGYRFRNKEIL